MQNTDRELKYRYGEPPLSQQTGEVRPQIEEDNQIRSNPPWARQDANIIPGTVEVQFPAGDTFTCLSQNYGQVFVANDNQQNNAQDTKTWRDKVIEWRNSCGGCCLEILDNC